MLISNTKSNYQDALKIIALVAMMVDHLGLYLYPGEIWLRIIGRFALPIFAFYAGYNFKGNIRHMIWICGLVLIVAWKIVFGVIGPNILIDLAVGQLYLHYAGKSILSNERTFLWHFLAMLVIAPFTFAILDYGTITIAFMQVGFVIANRGEDKGHLLLATCALLLFNLTRFNIDEIPLFIGMLFSISLASFMLYNIAHRGTIAANISIISRNMLYIYTSSVLLLIFLASYL